MTRKLKPYEVETIQDRDTQIRATIFLDRESKTFFASVGETTIEGKTHDECRRKTYEALRIYRPFVWEKVIVASVGHSTRSFGGRTNGHYGVNPGDMIESNLTVDFFRCQRTKSNAAPRDDKYGPRYLQRGFNDVDSKDDSKEAAFQASRWTTFSEYGENVILPYTEETWTKLVAIKTGIEELRRRLELLLDPKDAGRMLSSLNVRGLLPTKKD